MSAVFGLCGVRWTGEVIAINPRLPANWKKVTLPFAVRGQKLQLTLTHESITVKPARALEMSLSVSVGEKVYPLHITDGISISVERTVSSLYKRITP
jgi:hypothetical glycosyl hydrolase